MNKILLYFAVLSSLAFLFFIIQKNGCSDLPIVAIANYGPHVSLSAAIDGFKEEMANKGFVENQTIQYKIADAGFNQTLIPQMLSSLKENNPKVMVVMTTPVAQVAKARIRAIPLIYNVITDPVEAALIKNAYVAEDNMTGSSDKQDLDAFLRFVKAIMPRAESIGLLYATSESNDKSLVEMMRTSASKMGMKVVALPVDQAREVPLKVQEFKGKVDLIYVGSSGPIQPTLPAIAAESRKIGVPVFNVESQAVRDGLATASFGVDYKAVGKNGALLAALVLQGEKVGKINPIYPDAADHHGIINKKLANQFGIKIPSNVEVVG